MLYFFEFDRTSCGAMVRRFITYHLECTELLLRAWFVLEAEFQFECFHDVLSVEIIHLNDVC